MSGVGVQGGGRPPLKMHEKINMTLTPENLQGEGSIRDPLKMHDTNNIKVDRAGQVDF